MKLKEALLYCVLFFSECNLLRPYIHYIFGNNHIAEADAARMQRVAPFMFVPVQEAKHDDGNPAVNKNGIRQQVQPGFCGSADLPKHCHREDVLAYADDLPYLDGKHFIQYIGIERNEIVNVGADDKERREQQEVRLYQIDHAVQHNNVMFCDSFP